MQNKTQRVTLLEDIEIFSIINHRERQIDGRAKKQLEGHIE